MKILLIISLLCLSKLGYSQDSLLLVEKGKLVWLLGKVEESRVLKKRVALKDSIIFKQTTRINLLQEQNKSWARTDSLHTFKEAVLQQEITTTKGITKIYKDDNKKLKKQNFVLKVALVGVVSGFTYILLKE